MRNFFPEYKITHLPGEYYELAADILRNNPAEQAKFALESYLGGLNYSIAAKYEASNRMLNQALSVYAQMLPDKLDKNM